MVLTAKELQDWKDFPKGLRVLLLDEDPSSAAQIQSKLEQMEYNVSAFSNKDEALSAVSSASESFHIAILEDVEEIVGTCDNVIIKNSKILVGHCSSAPALVNLNNRDGRFKFLETAKELPTIMTSDIDCLTTTMKCIALGAVEFLRKPLSEEKLKNIWQHVVHKAFSAGGNTTTESIKKNNDSMVSLLQLPTSSADAEIQGLEGQDDVMEMLECDKELISWNEKFPAPSTPQLKHGGRLLDDMDYQDQTNSSTDKESGEHEGDTKFVETTCVKSIIIAEDKVDPPDLEIKGEDHTHPKESSTVPPGGIEKPNRELGPPNSSCGAKTSNKKKIKVDWTSELHKKFVQAVEQLGLDQAIPSRILELMKVEGLTRHNVASHLQKYRMQRRHILPKQDERRWPLPRLSMQRSFYPQHRPVMAFPPPYQSNHTYPAGQVYPIWGQAGNHRPPGGQMWGPPCYPWHPVENWIWKPYPGHADAWGCPVMPTVQPPSVAVPENAPGFHFPDAYVMPKTSDLQPGEEIIDRVVKEAISKPWLPLPIGLKPPSTDSVLAELSRQGIAPVQHRS